ncbi:MAG: GlsB/YeaQ/YmgE family stress response membrane protein [Pseudomonadota bacterium]
MNIVLWFFVGGLLGWLMSRVLSEPGRESTAVNLTVGLISATLAGWFLSPWLRADGGAGLNRVDLPALVLAIVGALVGLTLFNLVRQTMLKR